MDRVIFHIDVNNAFLSWEAVYRLEQGMPGPDLRTIACAVGGDVSKRHGVILAKSMEAKKYKVQTGEPITDALRKCPNLLIIPPTHDIYPRYSKAFMEILCQIVCLFRSCKNSSGNILYIRINSGNIL